MKRLPNLRSKASKKPRAVSTHPEATKTPPTPKSGSSLGSQMVDSAALSAFKTLIMAVLELNKGQIKQFELELLLKPVVNPTKQPALKKAVADMVEAQEIMLKGGVLMRFNVGKAATVKDVVCAFNAHRKKLGAEKTKQLRETDEYAAIRNLCKKHTPRAVLGMVKRFFLNHLPEQQKVSVFVSYANRNLKK